MYCEESVVCDHHVITYLVSGNWSSCLFNHIQNYIGDVTTFRRSLH